ncbi:MAG: RimK family alpha-L-glutamate ligase [Burkholderiaceae bacterium]|nr:RimK family alpha-L-glutamate ligase [Burkholderiaceae bacterium]
MRPLRVAIFTDERGGWHSARLLAALRARGAQGRCVNLAACRFDTGRSAHGLVIPGFGDALPDAAIVRGIAAGTFEQVTARLGILHALRELGVAVYNDARAIERSVDKAMTSFLLHRAGVPTPRAWAGESEAAARREVMRAQAAGAALVLKPLFGSQGKGVTRVGRVGRRNVALPSLARFAGYAYLQQYVDGGTDYDWRVFVIGGTAVAAMRRVSRHWVRNVAAGARCEAAPLSGAVAAAADLAQRAAAALGLDYAGVDLLPDADGRPWVIEVNGVPAWRGLQSVCAFDIAARLVDDLLDRRLRTAVRRAA